MPKGAYSVRCRPVVQNWPQERHTGFRPIPALHLSDVNTNAVISGPYDELYSLLNTNEVYDFTVAMYEHIIHDHNQSWTMRRLKVIKVVHNGRLIYEDFKDIPTK